MSNKTVFSIYTTETPDTMNFQSPLQISYLINEDYVIDISTGTSYPFVSFYQNRIRNTLLKIKDLFNKQSNIQTYQEWDRKRWYATNSLVYFYDDYYNKYKFYKALNMTNPLIIPTDPNNTHWNEYNSQKWYFEDTIEPDYIYEEGTVVHLFIQGQHKFYEAKVTTPGTNHVDNPDFWTELNLEIWDIDTKYNIGTRTYLDNIVYTAIQTVPAYTKIKDTRYWAESFDSFGIISVLDAILDIESDINIINLILEMKELITSPNGINSTIDYINSKIAETTTGKKPDDELKILYEDIVNKLELLNSLIEEFINKYNDLSEIATDSHLFEILWRNIYELKYYQKQIDPEVLNDPINILDLIRDLPTFTNKLNSDNKNIMVYIKQLRDIYDPVQKSGAYFIYDKVRDRFIRHLVGSEIYQNKDILDEIANAYDDINQNDTNSSKFLTIRKEKNVNSPTDQAWTFKAQWKDVDLIPDKPHDNKEYLLKTDKDGNLEWTDKFSSEVAFVKKEYEVLTDTNRVYIEDVDISYNAAGEPLDIVLLFKDSLFSTTFRWDYNPLTKTIELYIPDGGTFYQGDHLTLLIIRNTSAEMLYKLSNEYVSKKEAIDILSNGKISLLDYVRQEDLYKYTLRNHVHTNYANRIHTHDGIYASYHHHHDNYITREDLNKAISNILSINPDIVTIISQIATDLETLQNTFVTRDENVEVIMNIENRLTNLEEIQESSLYLKIFEDENTNLVSQVVKIGESNEFIPIEIDSLQIKTKYKKTDDPHETELFNLEEWLEYILGMIHIENQRVTDLVSTTLKSGLYQKNILYEPSVEEDVILTDINITEIKLTIKQPFDYPFSIRLGTLYSSYKLIEEDYINEDKLSVTEYFLNTPITTDSKLWIDKDPNEQNGLCSILISGYEI